MKHYMFKVDGLIVLHKSTLPSSVMLEIVSVRELESIRAATNDTSLIYRWLTGRIAKAAGKSLA